MFTCAGCGAALFPSDTKFESGSGWPSFYRALDDGVINEHADRSFGMSRTEITCARCGGHLGHVFPDGPAPDRAALLRELAVHRVRAHRGLSLRGPGRQRDRVADDQPGLEQLEEVAEGVGLAEAAGPHQAAVGVGQRLAGGERLALGQADRGEEQDRVQPSAPTASSSAAALPLPRPGSVSIPW